MSRRKTIFSSIDVTSLPKQFSGAQLAGMLCVLGVLIFLVFRQNRSERDTGGGAEAVSPAEIENLRAFAKLFGYVKYFHPSDAANAIDWERFAAHGVQQVAEASDPEDLRRKLEELFNPIAPTLQLYRAGEAPPSPAALLTPEDTAGLDLVAWQHRGVGLGNPGPYRSIRLHRGPATSGPETGPIRRHIDAAPYRGKEVRLEAALKTEVSGEGNRAQLWLQVNRSNNQRGFTDNMRDRPVTTSDWRTYEITGTVAEDAENISIGGILYGEGKAWLDDFQLLVRDGAEDEWTRVPLRNAGFEASAVGEPPTGWGTRVPGYQFRTTDAEKYEGERALLIASPDTGPLFEEHAEAGEVVRRPLGRQLEAQIPLALYSKDEQTLRPEDAPSLSELEAELDDIELDGLSAADEALRYADIVIAWNIFQHFYPYFDVVDVDWDGVLTETLQRAKSDQTDEDFLYTLRWMVAQLDDGHGRVQHPVMERTAGLPFLVDEVEGEVVIVAVADEAEEEVCFRRGDVVTAVDGTTAEQVLRESMQYISGSPQWKARRALREFGRGEGGTQTRLTLRRAGETVTCDAERVFNGRLQEERPAPMDELREGLYYVDLSRTEMSTIEEETQTLAEAEGIVFDLRGYPNGNHGVLQHLSEDTLRSARWQIPQQIYPDQTNIVGYDTTGRWTLGPKEPHLSGEIVFLTDERAISYAESILGIVEHYGLGEIVGQPTAGANGNANPFTLPGEYRLSWTGMRVVKNDRSQHHLVGIRPTLPVERTLQGVRSDRDEYLEKAIEVIELSERSGP